MVPDHHFGQQFRIPAPGYSGRLQTSRITRLLDGGPGASLPSRRRRPLEWAGTGAARRTVARRSVVIAAARWAALCGHRSGVAITGERRRGHGRNGGNEEARPARSAGRDEWSRRPMTAGGSEVYKRATHCCPGRERSRSVSR